jgi:hypothetical protein
MRLGPSQLALGALVALLWASACGGATGRNRHGEEAAGADHAPSKPGRGGTTGGTLVESEAGAPASSQGGSFGGAGAPDVLAGASGVGVGGFGAGGEVSSAAGAGGNASGAHAGGAGVGGEGGAPLECCEPLDCRDILGNLECGTNRYSDGCGGTFRCDCEDGLVCEQNSCVACDPGPEPCAADPSLCGAARDRCGNAISCPDNCADLGVGHACYEGRCCAPSKTACAADDCGHLLVGCGQSLDCTSTLCPDQTTCQPNGKCCRPSRVCSKANCGLKEDGCGNYLECSHVCPEGTVCLENECVKSECQAEAFECGQAYNIEVDGLEYCGSCDDALACRDHFCLPRCE